MKILIKSTGKIVESELRILVSYNSNLTISQSDFIYLIDEKEYLKEDILIDEVEIREYKLKELLK